ncbi:MAG TPA: phosphatidylglycerophosphatase A [Terriglobales bacterium]|nr:phosphatidylglycerophosphatase A [Terriglobales bacterium]
MESASIPTPPSSSPAPRWATLTATFFYIGKLKPGPGSWASAVTILIWIGITRWIAPHWQPWAAMGLCLVAVLVGIPVSTRVAQAWQKKDPSFVVIDEVAGQLIPLIGAPVTWKSLLAAFLLFRAFDILKPPPVRQLERIPQGSGIVLDDVGAGLYALIIMQLLFHFGVLPR